VLKRFPPDSSTTESVDHRQIRIDIEGTFNVRDVGGLAVTGGGRIRSSLLYRGDAIDAVTDAGFDSLVKLRLRTVIDLRESVERRHPQPDLGADVNMERMQILRDRFNYEHYGGLSSLYAAILDGAGEELAAVIGRLAEPGCLPALVHCSAGKDRSGLVIGLLLAAVGVPDAAIASNYAVTEANFVGEARDRALQRAADAGLSVQRLAVMVGSPVEAMTEALAHVRRRAGTVTDYLLGNGLKRGAPQRLRAALVEGDGLTP
jgi:protein-tyrosine phosphatase